MKLVKAWLFAFVVMFLLSWLWYGVIVYDFNAQHFAEVLRGEERFSMLLIVLGYLVMAFLLAYIYPKGVAAGEPPVSQGLKFGVTVGLLLVLPWALIEAGSYQFPLGARLLDALYHLVEITIGGMIIGWAYGETSHEEEPVDTEPAAPEPESEFNM